MSRIKQNLYFCVEGTDYKNLSVEDSIGTAFIENGEITENSSRYFGYYIRAAGFHGEAIDILKAALKNRIIPTKKTIIEISQKSWKKFCEKKDFSIIEKESKQVIPQVLDPYELEPGKIKDNYIIHEIKYFLEYQLSKTYISENLAFMLEMVDPDKTYKIKSSEISIPEYLSRRRQGYGNVYTDIVYTDINSKQKKTISFLDFYKLIK